MVILVNSKGDLVITEYDRYYIPDCLSQRERVYWWINSATIKIYKKCKTNGILADRVCVCARLYSDYYQLSQQHPFIETRFRDFFSQFHSIHFVLLPVDWLCFVFVARFISCDNVYTQQFTKPKSIHGFMCVWVCARVYGSLMRRIEITFWQIVGKW